jgi:flagellar hook-associated protein 1 FlgK
MPSTSRIIDIVCRALSAQQTGLSVTGHNISNVNTPGYKPQCVAMESNTTKPNNRNYSSWDIFKAGISIQTVERISNTFIDLEIQVEKKALNRWNNRERYYVEIESIYNEPSDIATYQRLISNVEDTNIATAMVELESEQMVSRRHCVPVQN